LAGKATGGKMSTPETLLAGEKVRLVVQDPEKVAELFSRWGHNGEFMRMLDADPIRVWSSKATQEWLEEEYKATVPDMVVFVIQTLEDDRPIGFVDLNGFQRRPGDAFIGIGLGEPAYWGKGYGTDAMQLIVRYAFQVLGLHRVSLNVFEYNPRAIRSYEKAGFQVEGRLSSAMQRDGKRWDWLYMGILRTEWELEQINA
jgi:RimJ/RimL family protein N-acetyltransferase